MQYGYFEIINKNNELSWWLVFKGKQYQKTNKIVMSILFIQKFVDCGYFINQIVTFWRG